MCVVFILYSHFCLLFMKGASNSGGPDSLKLVPGTGEYLMISSSKEW